LEAAIVITFGTEWSPSFAAAAVRREVYLMRPNYLFELQFCGMTPQYLPAENWLSMWLSTTKLYFGTALNWPQKAAHPLFCLR
jgi:hypothetical protein